MTVLGAVLTGGASRRMGRDKATIAIDGVAMVNRVGAALAEACSVVIAVGPSERAGTLRPVADLYPGQGPVGGVITALREAGATTGCTGVLVAACDLAWLDADTVHRLVDADWRAHDVAVARTDRIEPLCALWSTRSTAAVEQRYAVGDRAMHRVLDALDVHLVTVDPHALRNVNTPDDLARD